MQKKTSILARKFGLFAKFGEMRRDENPSSFTNVMGLHCHLVRFVVSGAPMGPTLLTYEDW